MAYIMSLNFEIGGAVDRAELESAASGIMKHLVNRGLVTNDLSEDELLEAFWVEVSPTNGEVTERASTPGPWSFDGHGINSSEGERIAKVQHGKPYVYPKGQAVRNERFDADSVLIAAAPEMADLLRRWEWEVVVGENAAGGLCLLDLATETRELLLRYGMRARSVTGEGA